MASKIGIMIDPGHYKGYNIGANKKYAEGTYMQLLAKYLKVYLKKYGVFNVYRTKTTASSNPSLSARGQKAINKKCDVFISLHSDAASPAACGVTVIRSLNRSGSVTLANKIGKAVAKTMKDINGVTYFRGTITRRGSNGDYYGVIRSSVTSSRVKYSFIVEHGFHTNKKECATLYNKSNLKKIAAAEAKAIYEYFIDKGLVEAPKKKTKK